MYGLMYVLVFNISLCTRWLDDVVPARHRDTCAVLRGVITCSILSMRLGREEEISTTYGALTSKAGLHDPVGNTTRTLDPLQLSQHDGMSCSRTTWPKSSLHYYYY